ncbi:hypothetical protein BSKO_01538 [Bryopsis sp. KO-2023]|nr:hypothetical protein BSKO_01538 [Bryopsis sp. KO-2023]
MLVSHRYSHELCAGRHQTRRTWGPVRIQASTGGPVETGGENSRRGSSGSDRRSVFSRTAFGCAAGRALEFERPDSLFKDPLARLLAGKEAIDGFTARKRILDEKKEKEGSAPGRLAYSIVIRTKFIDTIILAVTRSYPPPPDISVITDWLEDTGVGLINQVVLLGSGLDARPWRLDLHDGVHWFEVDRSEVVTEKQTLLLKAKAAIGSQDRQEPRFPLKVKKWVAVSSDIETLSFLHKLERRGLVVTEPVLWVMEGLLVYLEPEFVPRLLRVLNERCGFGSVLVVSLIMATSGSLRRRKAWKWGCPKNHMDECGWEIVTWIPMSAAYKMFGCRSFRPSNLTPEKEPKFLVARRIE